MANIITEVEVGGAMTAIHELVQQISNDQRYGQACILQHLRSSVFEYKKKYNAGEVLIFVGSKTALKIKFPTGNGQVILNIIGDSLKLQNTNTFEGYDQTVDGYTLQKIVLPQDGIAQTSVPQDVVAQPSVPQDVVAQDDALPANDDFDSDQ